MNNEHDDDFELKKTLHNFYRPSKESIMKLTEKNEAKRIEKEINSLIAKQNLEEEFTELDILKPKIHVEKKEKEMMIKIVKKLCLNYKIKKIEIFSK